MWPTDFDGDFTYQPDLPPIRVTFRRDGSRGWLEVADVDELEQVKVRLADKQIALEDALAVQGQAFALIRGLVDGTVDRSRVTLRDNGWTVEPAVVGEASAIAEEADRG